MSEEIKHVQEEEETPKLRVPAETYLALFGGALAIIAFAVVMFYAWFQVL
jgi:hypothetical protein